MGWGDILVIAAIAAFILLRYRAMLGEKHGPERDDFRREHESEYERVIQLPHREAPARAQTPAPSGKTYPEPLAGQFAAMQRFDRAFDPEFFIEGAKSAFEMVITAFNEADRATLRELLAPEIYKNFDSVLADREKEQRFAFTTLVSIEEVEIIDAALMGSRATLTVRFVSEQIHVVKDAAGTVIEGDASHIARVEDAWKFTRNLSSSNPAWPITQT